MWTRFASASICSGCAKWSLIQVTAPETRRSRLSDRYLGQASELLALQQPVVKLPQDERRQYRDVLRRIEEQYQAEERVEEWRSNRADVEGPPIVIVAG